MMVVTKIIVTQQVGCLTTVCVQAQTASIASVTFALETRTVSGLKCTIADKGHSRLLHGKTAVLQEYATVLQRNTAVLHGYTTVLHRNASVVQRNASVLRKLLRP